MCCRRFLLLASVLCLNWITQPAWRRVIIFLPQIQFNWLVQQGEECNSERDPRYNPNLQCEIKLIQQGEMYIRISGVATSRPNHQPISSRNGGTRSYVDINSICHFNCSAVPDSMVRMFQKSLFRNSSVVCHSLLNQALPGVTQGAMRCSQKSFML